MLCPFWYDFKAGARRNPDRSDAGSSEVSGESGGIQRRVIIIFSVLDCVALNHRLAAFRRSPKKVAAEHLTNETVKQCEGRVITPSEWDNRRVIS